ncbi:TPA: hypothetical protein ACIRVE_005085 [Pseudomonas putida]
MAADQAPIKAGDDGLTAEQLDDKYNADGDGEHPEFTRADWREAVQLESTLTGYWQWVEHHVSLGWV